MVEALLKISIMELISSGRTTDIQPMTIPRKTNEAIITEQALVTLFFAGFLTTLFLNRFSNFTMIGFIRKAITSPHNTGVSTIKKVFNILAMEENLKTATRSSKFAAITKKA